jgi:hypothetical protein
MKTRMWGRRHERKGKNSPPHTHTHTTTSTRATMYIKSFSIIPRV